MKRRLVAFIERWANGPVFIISPETLERLKEWANG